MAKQNARPTSLPVRWLPSAERAYFESLVYIAAQDQRSATLVQTRLSAALVQIATQPGIGTPTGQQGRRRFAIPKTGHLIEYKVIKSEVKIIRWARQTRKS